MAPRRSGASFVATKMAVGAVRATDDADCGGLGGGEAEEVGADESDENPELCGGAEQEHARVGDQRAEVGQRADAEEDDGGEEFQLDAL